jgi:hypothetical protein
MALAKCITRCWKGDTSRRYWPGDQDDIDPNHPVAKYFEFLDKGVKKAEVFKCANCGKEFNSVYKLRGHNMRCRPKTVAPPESSVLPT